MESSRLSCWERSITRKKDCSAAYRCRSVWIPQPFYDHQASDSDSCHLHYPASAPRHERSVLAKPAKRGVAQVARSGVHSVKWIERRAKGLARHNPSFVPVSAHCVRRFSGKLANGPASVFSGFIFAISSRRSAAQSRRGLWRQEQCCRRRSTDDHRIDMDCPACSRR